MILIGAMPAQLISVATRTLKCTWKKNTIMIVQAAKKLSRHKTMSTSMQTNAM